MILRRLRRWLLGERVVVVDAGTPPSEWTREDTERLRSFLRSRSGAKLVTMLRQLTVTEALSAIHAEAGKLPWANGKAAGVVQVVQLLDRLAKQAEPEAKADPSVPTDDLEWLTHERSDEDRRH